MKLIKPDPVYAGSTDMAVAFSSTRLPSKVLAVECRLAALELEGSGSRTPSHALCPPNTSTVQSSTVPLHQSPSPKLSQAATYFSLSALLPL